MANGFPQMPNLKELVLTDKGVYGDGGLLPITAFIWACPRLQMFSFKVGEFYFYMCSALSLQNTNIYITLFFLHMQFIGEVKDAASHLGFQVIERSPHHHLKTFEFQGLCGGVSDHIVELVSYISNKCATFREIILGRPLPGKPEVQADRDQFKRQLRAKLPHHIRLRFFHLT